MWRELKRGESICVWIRICEFVCVCKENWKEEKLKRKDHKGRQEEENKEEDKSKRRRKKQRGKEEEEEK